MTNLSTRCRQLLDEIYRDEAGASMVEYVFVILLVSILSIAAMGILGGNFNNKVNNVGTSIGT
jgi:Flp pilus assembly pilin Flp